jgi:hypothetical protein
MTKKTETENVNQRFKAQIGEEIAWVEVVSLKNKIYSVEYPGKEPVFITQIKDKDNRICWISMPQGNDQIAELIGEYIKKNKIQ